MIIERYPLKLLNGPEVAIDRWSVHPLIVCGGSIVNAADWQKLRGPPFGCSFVINLETEHSDKNKGIGDLLELPLPDDGTPKPKDWFRDAFAFFNHQIGAARDRRCYLHCQAGSSRTPTMLYFFMRKMGYSEAEALAVIRQDKPTFGVVSYHAAYYASAEAAL